MVFEVVIFFETSRKLKTKKIKLRWVLLGKPTFFKWRKNRANYTFFSFLIIGY